MEVLFYLTADGGCPFEDWVEGLNDAHAATRIIRRVDRLADGGFGDWKPLHSGVRELRIDWGPGYRVYYAISGKTAVLLLCGGDKRKQDADVQRAVAYWIDYQKRMREE